MVVAVDIDHGKLAIQHADLLLPAPGVQRLGIDCRGVAPEDEDFLACGIRALYPSDAATLALGEDGEAEQPVEGFDQIWKAFVDFTSGLTSRTPAAAPLPANLRLFAAGAECPKSPCSANAVALPVVAQSRLSRRKACHRNCRKLEGLPIIPAPRAPLPLRAFSGYRRT
jgi:hypothetical protein